MKRTAIFLSIPILLVIVFFVTGNAVTPVTGSVLPASPSISENSSCVYPCLSIIVLQSPCKNCSGTYCGTGTSSTSFSTDGNGEFMLPCKCAGTYYFCLDGKVYVVTVDGSGNYFYPVETAQLCPCGGK